MVDKRLKRIPVGSTSECSQIVSRKRYRVRIEGRWYEGFFSKKWFGWQFDDYGTHGIQLNLIDEIYEILRSPPNGSRKRGSRTP